jgi:hypothetical protein
MDDNGPFDMRGSKIYEDVNSPRLHLFRSEHRINEKSINIAANISELTARSLAHVVCSQARRCALRASSFRPLLILPKHLPKA